MIKNGLLISLLLIAFWAEAGLFGDKKVKVESFDGDKHGLVVLQISTNSNYQRGLSNWDYVTIKSMGDGKSFRLVPIYDFKKYGSVVFGGYLKPGRYVIEDIYEDTEYAGGVIFNETHTVEGNQHDVNFNVVLNQITDIGTVLLHPQHHGVDNYSVIKSFSMIQVQDDGLDLVALMKNKYKDTLSDVTLNTQKTKLTQPPELSSGLPFKYYYQQNSAERMMLHRHGLISRKVEGGEWQQFNTGRVQQYNAIAQVSDGYILGGEYGALLFSQDLVNWRVLDLLPVNSNVMNIQVMDDVIELSVHTPDRRLKTYHLSSGFLDIKEVSSEKLKNINYRTDQYNRFEDVVQANGFVLSKGVGFDVSVQFNDEMKPVNIYAGKPRDYFISGYNYNREAFVAEDKTLYLISSPVKRFKEGFHRLKSFRKPYQLNLYRGPINKSLPYDNTYLVSAIENRCSTFVSEISVENELYLSCINGDLLVSLDQGKTWTLDFQTGIKSIY